MSFHRLSLLLTLLLLCKLAAAQTQQQHPPFLSLQTPDSLYKARLWTASAVGTASYGITMVGLYQAWYADYPSGRFHFFNDLGEWNQMDKTGHFLMSYQESRWLYGGARWTGLSANKAAWLGFAGGQLIQTSFEIYDGFSTQWGFSWSDVGFNVLGGSLFLGQQLGWKEQRVVLKMSAMPVRFPNTPIYPEGSGGTGPYTTLQQRSDNLYGSGPANLFLKNYNALVVWASVNPRSFLGDRIAWWPRWLNIAGGMGADNMFAGYGYTWKADKNCTGPECVEYRVDPLQYPRTRQFFLSLDIDYTRLGVRKKWLKTLLSAANIIKFPAPALEWRDHGATRFHFVYF